MKRFLVLIMASLMSLGLIVGPATSADVGLIWKASPGATGYKVEYSADHGVTWSTPKDIGLVAPVDYVSGTTHLLMCSYTWTGLPDTGVILLRVSAYNAVGTSTRVDAGAWFNKAWTLPPLPGGAGIQ